MFSDWFKSVPIIETNRLILRPFSSSDLQYYIQEFSNPNVRKYLGGVLQLKNEKEGYNWLRNVNDRLLKKKLVFTWLITNKNDTNQSFGRIDLGGFTNKKAAEVSYYIWENYWNNGYASESIKKIIHFGLNDLELSRIQAIVDTENSNSIKVLQKCGFHNEGLLRNYPIGKSIKDVYMFSIINQLQV